MLNETGNGLVFLRKVGFLQLDFENFALGTHWLYNRPPLPLLIKEGSNFSPLVQPHTIKGPDNAVRPEVSKGEQPPFMLRYLSTNGNSL